MNYTNKIIEKIDFLNSILVTKRISKLLSNTDFIVDDLSTIFYLKLNFNKTIILNFILTDDEFQIDIDRISEAYIWNNNQLFTDYKNIESIILMILTCNIKVEYKGDYFTKLYFINKEGRLLNTLKSINGMFYFVHKSCFYNYPSVY
jgi:hypothetical protein